MMERTHAIEARALKDERTVQLAISSEYPVERYFGIEILDHTPEAIDLSRLADGRHPLLVDHARDRQAGVLREPQVGGDRVLRATARFSRSALGAEVYQDVQDEIRTLVSVGYEILQVREEKTREDGTLEVVRELDGATFAREMEAAHGPQWSRALPAGGAARGDKVPTFRVIRWMPWEASIVSIPADPLVGVGRAAGAALPPPLEVTQPQAGAAANASEATRDLPRIEVATPQPQPLQESRNMNEQQQTAPADVERQRVSDIATLGEQYAKYITSKDTGDAIRNGRTAEQFKDLIMERMTSRHSDTSALHIGMGRKEVQRYSMARAIVASITGNWKEAGLELECSRAVEKIMGATPEGFFVPFEAWNRDFNVGTSSEAGNLVPVELRTDLYVDALRNALVLARMGIRILPGLSASVDIPRKSVAGTIGSLTEIGSASETNPNTALLSLRPKRIGAYTEYSKQALIQSALALEPMIRDDLLQGAAVKFENMCINGAGTAAEFLGVRNTSGIGTVAMGANGAALDWGSLVDLESACANNNAEPDMVAGYIINTRARGKAKKVTKSTNLPFIWSDGATPLNGYRVGVTNNVPSNLTKGTSTTICSAGLFASDWSMAVLGLFGAPDIVVDPYTKADTGQVKITLNQFGDFGLRQPAAFAKVEDWLTT